MEAIKAIALAQSLEHSALSVRGAERQLSCEEHQQLTTLCEQMQAHYPHQEFADETVKGYLFDLERLAVLHGLDVLRVALLNLRLRPGQKFFPHPSEVAEEIEQMLEADREASNEQARRSREARDRQLEVDMFWNQILPDRMQRYGWTEAEALERYPSMRGTKPSSTGGVR
jgi:hypothetical protein